MNRFTWIVIFCAAGCLSQGIKSVYFVMIETEPLDVDGDGRQNGISVFLLFTDRELEPVSFYDAECKAILRVYDGKNMIYEKEVFFDSSELVGRAGGGISLRLDSDSEYGDIKVIVVIAGRGEFHSEKKNVKLS
jgi:hypothetical protein